GFELENVDDPQRCFQIIMEADDDGNGFILPGIVVARVILADGNNPSNIYWFILQPNYWNWNPTVQIYDYKPVKQPDLKDFIADVDWNTMPGEFNPFVFVKHKVKCDIISSNLAKIDLSKNQIGDFVNYQVDKAEKKSYYLCPGKPLMLTNDNKLLLFGSQSMKKGKTLWFARFLLE
ncbi:MAG TPA: hypothetical protein PLK82_09160, partial [Bacteroidales bacterium]|nr:hypothetical protein [Bacteroidales bacterium]